VRLPSRRVDGGDPLSIGMSARAWTLFAAVSTVWGIPYLFIKIGVDGGVPPVTLAWGRIVLASIVLLGLAARAGALPGLRGRWRYLVAYGVVELSIPFPMIATGERYLGVEEIDDHRQPAFEVEAGVDRGWLDESEREAPGQRIRALTELAR